MGSFALASGNPSLYILKVVTHKIIDCSLQMKAGIECWQIVFWVTTEGVFS